MSKMEGYQTLLSEAQNVEQEPALQIHVCLLSSRCITLTLSPGSPVKELQSAAERYFRMGALRLFSANGRLLKQGCLRLQDVGLQDGDTVTAIAEPLKLAAHPWGSMMCAFSISGPVVTWGDGKTGKTGTSIAPYLVGVQAVQATSHAFAAICHDGSVVCWGDPEGDCTQVAQKLRNVKEIQRNHAAFAAILTGGTVVCWGRPEDGGDCSSVQQQLANV